MNRKKALVLSLGAALLVAGGVVGSAFAQAPPPPLPSTVYGDVLIAGTEEGDLIYAVVDGPTGSEVCGYGEVIDDPDRDGFNPVYVIDVKAQEPQDDPLCGTTGRTIRFYVAREHGFAGQTTTWATGVRPELDLSTVTQELGEVAYAANSSYSGIQQ